MRVLLHSWILLYQWFFWSLIWKGVAACPVSLIRRNPLLVTSRCLLLQKLQDTDDNNSNSISQQLFNRDNNDAPWRQQSENSLDETVAMLAAASSFSSPSSIRLWVGGLMAILALQKMEKLYKSEPVRRAAYFWRHAGPIVAHYKLTKNWLRICHADQEQRDRAFEQLHDKYAQPALNIALQLRGLYIKLGQIMSSRPDFLPQQYVMAFTELQDNVPAWETEVVQATAEQALLQECPAFREYEHLILDPVALGSASIGQVHRGILTRKNGKTKEVAVKVMHEGARGRFQHDFQVFRWLCRIAIPTWLDLLNALEKQVMTEFDYRNEAASLREVRENMQQSPYRRRVVVPEPMEELCCEKVLVMEMLHGKKLIDSIEEKLAAAFGGSHEASKDFLARRRHEVLTGEDMGSNKIIQNSVGWLGKLKLLFLLRDCRQVIDLLVQAHGHQIFENGTWNSDPHFGNCLHLHDGRLGLIDYGQTRRMGKEQRIAFAKVILALEESKEKRAHGQHSHRCFFNASSVANAMRQAGFSTRNNTDDDIMLSYARILFDSDEEGEEHGFVIPQEYFASLMHQNPLIDLPESALFVARTSLMFRGMGSAIGSRQIGTAARWYNSAKNAVARSSTM